MMVLPHILKINIFLLFSVTLHFNFRFVVKTLDMQLCIWSKPFVVLAFVLQ